MEQDAIETLLFMSSPGNSAYHPHSQRQQSASHLSNTSITAGSSTTHSRSQDSQAEGEVSRLATGPLERARCLEAQAGDEIDRMLDQMEDTDSEEDNKPARRRFQAT
ncbi:uncharacterized protein ACLA_074070 [Aspergillus clavatus NRRL 1]|uniref:Uncharacterized protein n=1 Tax=Aspergillus clavatus (strain ATCC 1007 / CBS 513.65 / DSM 816 / NCTC 3887 / NRRL 1 / QM 1276 / 107) TaxID=344612 RepID=A1C7J9_ASPCL|nr:uncharacterized protein ACLA_074070 [Aspergillus clavatus NRRL 1]EAW14370.1 hypothetical protein ACLA_074070 [Aspergillus clavatus NRRL 1]